MHAVGLRATITLAASALCLLAGCASADVASSAPPTLPPELRIVPAQVSAQEQCKELVLQAAPPGYPAKARAEGRSGWALVGFALDGSGKAVQPTLLDSSGGAEFQRAALEALTQTRFRAGATAQTCRLVFDWTSVRRIQ